MKASKQLTGMMLATLVLFSSCSGSEDKKDVNAGEDKVFVKVDTVRLQPIQQLYDFTATIQPGVKNNIASSMPGRIASIKVEVGDHVSKGQLLATMDPANLLQVQTQLANLELDYSRTEELYKAGGAPKQAVDQLKTQLDVVRTNYKNLAENVNLVSPINGIVTSRNYDSGDLYGGAIPILTVMQIKPVKVMINISESYFSQIKPGMEVDVYLDIYEGEKFKGKVSLIYPTIDYATRTLPVEISIPNKDEKIRPGMFARVVINFGNINRVVVPDLAIVKRPGSGDRFVYVYKNGKVSYNQVELGRRLGSSYELISGVENGDLVVVSGQSRLADGTPVEIETSSPNPADLN
jgi:RND family efflux transporter MFP subunit